MSSGISQRMSAYCLAAESGGPIMAIFSSVSLAHRVNDSSVGSELMYDNFSIEADGEEILYTEDWNEAVNVYWEYRELAEVHGYYDHISIKGRVIC